MTLRWLVFLTGITVALGQSPQGALSGPGLFNRGSAQPVRPAFTLSREVLRAQAVRLNLAALTPDPGVAAGVRPEPQTGVALAPAIERTRLALFDDVELSVRWSRMEKLAPESGGGQVWFGAVDSSNLGEAIMVVQGNMVAGNFTGVSGRMYQVRTTDDGQVWVTEVDTRAFPAEEPQSMFQLRAADRSDAQGDAGSGSVRSADDPGQIDVMVVWTPASRQKAGGLQAMQQLVQLGIAETNQGYRNSGISLQVRLVYSGEVNYTEASDIDTDLTRLIATNDGHLDQIHQLRDTWGADLVSLWAEHDDFCGIASMLSNPARPDRGFSVVARSCATGYYSFGHEMGHNLGATHAAGDGGGPGYYPYSQGWKVNGRFRTVMAYLGTCQCDRVNYWSNPAISYSGVPTGTATTAYNALTLNNTRGIVANYRAARGGGGGEGGSGLPESDHPYADRLDKTWTYTAPGNPASIVVTFDPRTSMEAGYDFLHISDGNNRAVTGSPFSGTALSGRSVQITGSTVRLRLVTDADVNDYGFKVTSVTPNAGSGNLPRIEVTAFSAPATAVTGTRNVAVRTSLSNSGTAAAGQFRLGFYVSRDAAATVQDIFTGYSCTFANGLAAGTSTTCNGDIEIPATVAPGVWYVAAIADDRQEVTQSDRSRGTRLSDAGPMTIAGNASAEITTPLANATLTSATATFSWTAGLSATGYVLSIGSAQGGSDIFSRDMGTERSVTVRSLPTDGRRLYVRLTTKFGTANQSVDYGYTAVRIVASEQPRLVLTSFSAPDSGSAGVNLTGTRLSISNVGSGNALPFRIGFYFGAGSNVTSSDTFSGWSCTFGEGLAAGASSTCSGDIGVPESLRPGRYYLAAIADDQNRNPQMQRSEATRTSDNGPLQIAGRLAAALTAPVPGSGIGSSSVTLQWSPGSAGAEQYYVRIGSQQGGLDIYDADQGLNRSVTVSNLPVDGRQIWVTLYTRFGSDWFSNEYPFRTADSRTSIAPRIVVTVFTAPTSGAAGGKLPGTRMTVVNQGNGNAGPFRVGYYWSRQASVKTSDVFSGWYCDLPQGLAVGGQWTCSGEIGVPASLASGLWYVAAIADYEGKLTQSSTAGNVRASENGPLTITNPGSDLPESAHPYANSEDRTWTYTIPGARSLSVVFDRQTATEEDYDFITLYDGSGGSVATPFSGTYLSGKVINVPGPTVKIRLTSDDSVVDWGFKVTRITEGTGSAHLAVTSFTAPNTGTAGGKVSMRVVVKNTGSGAAGAFRIGFYLSRASNVTTTDVWTGWYCTVDSLAPGESSSCAGQIGLPVGITGNWYMAAIADDRGEISQADRSESVRLSENGRMAVSAVDLLPDAALLAPALGEGENQFRAPVSGDEVPGPRSRPSKR
jgi:hypothetical protein